MRLCRFMMLKKNEKVENWYELKYRVIIEIFKSNFKTTKLDKICDLLQKGRELLGSQERIQQADICLVVCKQQVEKAIVFCKGLHICD